MGSMKAFVKKLIIVSSFVSSARAFIVGGTSSRVATASWCSPYQQSSSKLAGADDIKRLRSVGYAARAKSRVRLDLVPSPRTLLRGESKSLRRGLAMNTGNGEMKEASEEDGQNKETGPVGLEGLEEDESLFELVGHDYGMMAMLRSEKFRGLIVYLRNVPQREWVSAVEKEYGDDDEVKGMMVQLGKLMHMQQYYENQRRKMKN